MKGLTPVTMSPRPWYYLEDGTPPWDGATGYVIIDLLSPPDLGVQFEDGHVEWIGHVPFKNATVDTTG